MSRSLWLRSFVAALAFLALGTSLWKLESNRFGLSFEEVSVSGTPVRIIRPDASTNTPSIALTVVIAHGFAGSSRLMEPFGTSLARAGATTVSFDFLGHGNHPAPLTGDVADIEGATRKLVDQTTKVMAFARTLDRNAKTIALLGHSMASDILVRTAECGDAVDAVVAISMFAPSVTEDCPRNLLVIVGAWEGSLVNEGQRAVSMATEDLNPESFTTYGSKADGTARRLAIAANVEHVSVLYSQTSLREAVEWLTGASDTSLDNRGGWLVVGMISLLAFAWPAFSLLPRINDEPVGAAVTYREMAWVIGAPAVLTPLLLWQFPTDFLDVLIADYVSLHFGLFGLLAAIGLLIARKGSLGPRRQISSSAMIGALAFTTLFCVVFIAWYIDRYMTSYWPSEGRFALIGILFVGCFSFFMVIEYAVRGREKKRGGYIIAKAAFAFSLAAAVALNVEALFFLALIIPIIIVFFVLYGFFSVWSYAKTKHPLPGAFVSALALAWGIGVCFPMLAN